MKIGHLLLMKNGKTGDDARSWLQLVVQPVGMNRISATAHLQTTKKTPQSPDYKLYESINRRGDKEKYGGNFPNREIGVMFKKKDKNQNDFLSVKLTCGLDSKDIYFSLFKAEAYGDQNPEEIFWLYDAVTPQSQSSNNQQNNDYAGSSNNYNQATNSSTAGANPGETIPMQVENKRGKPATDDELRAMGLM